MLGDFGYFHREAAETILPSNNITAALEWPREHAKSVYTCVFLTLYRLAKKELTGLILASGTEDKAKGLIGDIKAELMKNKRFIHDFGDQKASGSWLDGKFITADGIGFWAFGIGQNPAGVREGEKRPNMGIVDDADSLKKYKNQEILKNDLDWILGEFLGCLTIRGKWLIYCNNRIRKNGLTAHFVGDVEENDPKRKGLYHSKVYATEDPETREMLLPENGGVPAWREFHTIEHLITRIHEMGHRNAMRQFFHKHIEDGNVFKLEHLPWGAMLPLDKYDTLCTYTDPSLKASKKNDFKAIVLLGKKGNYYHVIKAWVHQATPLAMAKAHCALYEYIRSQAKSIRTRNANFREKICIHWIEHNALIYDELKKAYLRECKKKHISYFLKPDKQNKGDKVERIENNLSPLAEAGLLIFNEEEKKNQGMINLRDQFLGFPNGHDDGPDAVEGGVEKLNHQAKSKGDKRTSGSYKNSSKRHTHERRR